VLVYKLEVEAEQGFLSAGGDYADAVAFGNPHAISNTKLRLEMAYHHEDYNGWGPL